MKPQNISKPYRTFLLLLITIFLLGGIYSVALAAPPVSGTVVEGVQVPGAALGDTRDEIMASYGEPSYCQGPTQGFCTYNIPGYGSINIWYEGPGGGEATGAGNDVMFSLSWYQFEDWVTTAGINTTLALNDPDAVLAAYPNGVVTYYSSGAIYKVREYELGIEVRWNYDFYTGITYVNMQIFEGTTPPPPQNDLLRVSSISMAAGRKNVTALVQVTDQYGTAVSGAAVEATWTLPNGSTTSFSGVTDAYGEVLFTVKKSKGTHTLSIESVSLAGYEFDPDNSVLTQSLTIGGGRR